MSEEKIKYSINNIKITMCKQSYNTMYAIYIESTNFELLSTMIKQEFNLDDCTDMQGDITGEQMFQTCRNKDYIISLGFGKWYPFVILSENKESNIQIEKIFNWLQAINVPV